MRWFEAVLVVVVGALLISGGSASDPRTPRGLPGLPAPFLGTAVVGSGGRTAAVDAYGDFVDLRAAGPAGRGAGGVGAGGCGRWAYVWPRDAAAVAIGLAEAGYKSEAQRVARFLLGLDLNAAARFRGTGAPVPGRDAQGDAGGWVSAAAWAVGLRPDMPAHGSRWQWR